MEYESMGNDMMSKQEHWNEISEDIEKITDSLGKPIEEGIKETIIGLCTNDFHTTSSCAGHVERHLAFPYVHVESEGRPQYRYEGEEELAQNLLQKYQLRGKNEIFSGGEAEQEYNNFERTDPPETPEYKIWKEKNYEERKKLDALIEEYAASSGESVFRIQGVSPSYRLEAHEDRDGETDEEKKDRIVLAQKAFQRLTEFLKQRYFQGNT